MTQEEAARVRANIYAVEERPVVDIDLNVLPKDVYEAIKLRRRELVRNAIGQEVPDEVVSNSTLFTLSDAICKLLVENCRVEPEQVA